jgi:hypothetical protein
MPFYHKKVLSDPATTVSLITDDGKEFVCPLTEGLNMSASITWSDGGDLFASFMDGIAEGANKFLSTARSVKQSFAHAANAVVGTSFDGPEQGKLITATSAHRKYQGSDTKFGVPPLVFTFLNETDTSAHIDAAKDLLNYVLPRVSGSNDEVLYELPPSNFKTDNKGFSGKGIKGSLTLRIGARKVKYFVPNSVAIRFSADTALDPLIPHAIEITITVEPAIKYTSDDIFSIM